MSILHALRGSMPLINRKFTFLNQSLGLLPHAVFPLLSLTLRLINRPVPCRCMHTDGRIAWQRIWCLFWLSRLPTQSRLSILRRASFRTNGHTPGWFMPRDINNSPDNAFLNWWQTHCQLFGQRIIWQQAPCAEYLSLFYADYCYSLSQGKFTMRIEWTSVNWTF